MTARQDVVRGGAAVPTAPTAPAAPMPYSRQGSLMTTTALATVLLSLAAFVAWGSVTTTRAVENQKDALEVAAIFEQVQYHVAVEELYARQYQLEPSSAVRTRYELAARRVVEVLGDVDVDGDSDTAARVQATVRLQSTYRAAADRMVQAVTVADPRATQIDALEVAPAYFTLQEHAIETATFYRVEARRRVEDLGTLQRRLRIGTIGGFSLGLVLLAMIWKLVLGYQRNLVHHADASAHMALHDPLTGLPNRTYFGHRLALVEDVTKGRLQNARRRSQDAVESGIAILVVDLDRFKEVNDTLGHHAGDLLLVQVGQRLQRVLREEDTVARLGGDEFAMLLPQVPSVEVARDVAERAAASLRRPFDLDGTSVAIAASIGVACAPWHGSVDDLVHRADLAMYRAKAGALRVAVYDERHDVDDPARLALFGDLQALLDSGDPEGQLVLYYQPQLRLSDGGLAGLEALVRWRHPGRGLLPPGEFLPLAEETGQEVALTYHLLDLAVAEAAEWRATGESVPVAVNVSPRCLLDDQFVDTVRDTLARYRLHPRLLRIEVTEGSVMTDPERSSAALRSLAAEGVGVSVDDFGSGYSSLGQLRRLPVDELKIDQSFVRNVALDADDAVLVRSAIDLGHHLGTVVVAEGVEDVSALLVLRDMGCDVVQGYYLARPVPVEALPEACRQANATMLKALAMKRAVA